MFMEETVTGKKKILKIESVHKMGASWEGLWHFKTKTNESDSGEYYKMRLWCL